MIAESIHKRLKQEELDTTLSTLRITRPGDLSRMRGSLERSGQLNPIVVRLTDAGFQILDGFKRVFAARDLGWEELGPGSWISLYIRAKLLC